MTEDEFRQSLTATEPPAGLTHACANNKNKNQNCSDCSQCVVPIGYLAWTVLPDTTSDEQERILGVMIVRALLFILFTNLAIWGFGRKPK